MRVAASGSSTKPTTNATPHRTRIGRPSSPSRRQPGHRAAAQAAQRLAVGPRGRSHRGRREHDVRRCDDRCGRAGTAPCRAGRRQRAAAPRRRPRGRRAAMRSPRWRRSSGWPERGRRRSSAAPRRGSAKVRKAMNRPARPASISRDQWDHRPGIEPRLVQIEPALPGQDARTCPRPSASSVSGGVVAVTARTGHDLDAPPECTPARTRSAKFGSCVEPGAHGGILKPARRESNVGKSVRIA